MFIRMKCLRKFYSDAPWCHPRLFAKDGKMFFGDNVDEDAKKLELWLRSRIMLIKSFIHVMKLVTMTT